MLQYLIVGVLAWTLLSIPVALVLGSMIRRAERQRAEYRAQRLRVVD